MSTHRRLAIRRRAAVLLAASLLGIAGATAAADVPHPGTVSVASAHGYADTVARLEKSIEGQNMGLVARASASQGAAARGIKIPGNAVLMVFRNDYAVRMLAASVPAGIEAPLRIYVTEGQDGKARITYRRPTAVFAPYRSAALDAMAQELDPIFERIVADAAR